MEHIIIYRPIVDGAEQPVKAIHYKNVDDAHAVMSAINKAYLTPVQGSKVGGIILNGDVILDPPTLFTIVEVDLDAIGQGTKDRAARERAAEEAANKETAFRAQQNRDEAEHVAAHTATE